MGVTQIIGAAGEEAATEWLQANGFEVVVRNWRCGRYELDIVARRRREGTIHFVEVKCRAEGAPESPEDAMTVGKQRAFRLAAQAWLAANPSDDFEPQMDLVAVETASDGSVSEVRYIPEAVISRW